MRVAVVGGSGTLGAAVSRALESRGADVRRISRSSPDWPADVTTGEGLAAALEDCDTVVDASNGPPSKRAAGVLVEGTRRLLDVGHAAGVRHHVCASIIGCDRVPTGYYDVKVRQEELVAAGDVPWTIVRITQFHELVAMLFAAAARFGVVPSPSAPLQPIAAAEAGDAVAGFALGDPRGGRVEVAGPAARPVRELALAWRRSAGKRALPVPVPMLGRAGRAVRDGALTCENPSVAGTLGFEDWLAGARA